MHEYLLSVFLGIVEGLTEFLPVSSTAHLRICEALLHIDLHDGFWKMYTIVIQLGAILAFALLIGGIVMWIVDAVFTRPRTMHMEEMTLPQAIWIGAAQILSAVFPGTSRSMSTIAAGQVAGLSRPAALEFSFFLSMPTMVVATGFDFLKTVMPHHHETDIAPLAMNLHEWIVLG